MSCGIGHRQGLDLALLWLWCRPATVTLIRLIAWEPPCVSGVALKDREKKKSEMGLGVCQFSLDQILLRDEDHCPQLSASLILA